MPTFKIEDFCFVSEDNLIIRNGQQTSLEHNATKLLQCLCENAGDPVSKTELINYVWSGKTVSDNTLSRLITKIRRAFEESSKDCRILITVPKKGYKLAVDVALWEQQSNGVNAAVAESMESTVEPSLDIAEPLPVVEFAKIPEEPNKAAEQNRYVQGYLMVAILFVALLTSYTFWHAQPLPERSGDETKPLYVHQSGIEDAVLLEKANSLLILEKTAETQKGRLSKVLLSSAEATVLQSSGENISAFAVSHDEGFVALVVRGERCEIRRLSLSTRFSLHRSEHLFTCSNAGSPVVKFGPHGRYLYFTDRSEEGAPYQIFRLNLGNRSVEALKQPVTGSPGNYGFDILQDGTTLLILNGAEDRPQQIFTMDMEESALTLNASFDAPILSIHGMSDEAQWAYVTQDEIPGVWMGYENKSPQQLLKGELQEQLRMSGIPGGEGFILMRSASADGHDPTFFYHFRL